MITTKAYITKTPEVGDNIFEVNIPLMADNVNDEALFEALLCSTSGNYNDYKVGDCVFVDFEDDKYNTAIIMGKLYTDVPEENEAYGLFNELKVTGSVTLPEDTRIGKYTPQDIFNLYQVATNLNNIPSVDEFIDWTDLKEYLKKYLKKYVSKQEFNEFFSNGDTKYFSESDPYGKDYEFNDNLEVTKTVGQESKQFYNKDFKPHYTNFISAFIKDFLSVKLNKFLGQPDVSIPEGSTTKYSPSITQIINKINTNGSQTYTASNITNVSNPTAGVDNTKYFPNYTNLVTHLRSFFSTDLPTLITKIKNWATNWATGTFVKYNKSDYGSSTTEVTEVYVRVVSANQWTSDGKKSNTIYFLTDVPS